MMYLSEYFVKMLAKFAKPKVEDNLKVTPIKFNNCVILKVEKKILDSNDLDILINHQVINIRIDCEKLSLFGNLPKSYRGKDVIINAKSIELLSDTEWDLSGKNANDLTGRSTNGRKGENGGNLVINCDEIINSHLWTIKSNGGNGPNGETGSVGKPGQNGLDAQAIDFSVNNEVINNSNFQGILERIGFSLNFGSERKKFFENGKEKIIIFNKNQIVSEAFMLVKGTKGGPGMLGGSGSDGGPGGRVGKLERSCAKNEIRFIACDGKDGKAGKFGQNGLYGKDGRDAYMIMRSNESEPTYFGLDKSVKFQISQSCTEVVNSIFYQPLNVFLYASRNTERTESDETIMDNDEFLQAEILANRFDTFCQLLHSTLTNSNLHFNDMIKDIRLDKFLRIKINNDSFLFEIVDNDTTCMIPFYDQLKQFAIFFTQFSDALCDFNRDAFLEYIKIASINKKGDGIVEIKRKVLTSDDINKLDENLTELHIICEVLHLNVNLHTKFNGKNVAVLANDIHVHDKVLWNVSPPSRMIKSDDEAGESGGNCHIKCKSIFNASLWTIQSNGEDGVDGEDGDGGTGSVWGISPSKSDMTITNLPPRNIHEYNEDGFEKELYCESSSAFLLLVRGTEGHPGSKGKSGKSGTQGGFAGEVIVDAQSCDDEMEIKIVGIDGLHGKDGKSGMPSRVRSSCPSGYDRVMYYKDHDITYFGLKEKIKYEIAKDIFRQPNSVLIDGHYYYPRRIFAIEFNATISDDINLYQHLITVLRHSAEHFDDFVTKLNLLNFIQGNVSFSVVKSKILSHNLSYPHYKRLMRVAENYKTENLEAQKLVREKLKEWLEPINCSVSSKIVTVSKKLLMSSEFTAMKFEADVEEFHIVCDTLHINSDLPSEFQGKNITIIANFVQVHKPSEWNLSGNILDLNRYDLENPNGSDGLAGKSGGHFTLECKFIENASSLKIISNGSNGLDGENGRDGKNGADGRHASKEDFNINGITINMISLRDPKKSFKQYLNDAMQLFVSNSGSSVNFKSESGLEGRLISSLMKALVIVKGEAGKPGQEGQLGGLGGDGGYPGEISIKCENPNDQTMIQRVKVRGKAGKNGINGYNGIKGRDGGDIGGFLSAAIRRTYGENENKKLVFKKSSFLMRIAASKFLPFVAAFVCIPIPEFAPTVFLAISSLQQLLPSVYDPQLETEVGIVEDGDPNIPSNEKFRNTAKQSRLKMSHAVATKKSRIDIEVARDKAKMVLNDSIGEISHLIEVKTEAKTSRKEAVVKSKIDINAIKAEHQNYIMKIDFVNQQRQISEAHKVRKVLKFDPNRIASWMIPHRVARVPRMRLTYEFMISSSNKSTVEWFEFLRTTELEPHQFQYLTENLSQMNIHPEEYKDYQNATIFDILKTIIYKQREETVSEFIDNALKSAQFGFIRNIYKNIKQHFRITVNDLVFCCEEKNLFFCYQKIYNELNKSADHLEIDKSTFNKDIRINSPNFYKNLQYLTDSLHFESNLDELNSYFRDDSDAKRIEVSDFLNEKLNDNQSALAEIVMNILVQTGRYGTELNECREKLRKFDEKLASSNSESLKTLKTEFDSILNKLYKNVEKLILDELENEGVKSRIYREILAFKYNVNFVICTYNADNDLQLLELNNYCHPLRFEYEDYKQFKKSEDTDSIFNPQDGIDDINCDSKILILFSNETFTTLDIDTKRYNYTQHVKKLCEKFKEEIAKHDNELIKVFHADPVLDDARLLFECAMSMIESESYSMKESESAEISRFRESIQQDHIDAVKSRILKYFQYISNVCGSSILKAINIKLFDQKRHTRTLEEFSAVIDGIFTILFKYGESFAIPLTFMILGIHEKSWKIEIIIILIQSIIGTVQHDLLLKWKNILRKNIDNEALPLLLQKLSNFHVSHTEQAANEETFDLIMDNLNYFEADNIGDLKESSLYTWGQIITNKYLEINIELLANHNPIVRAEMDQIRNIFENMSTRYGTQTRKLMNLLVKNLENSEIANVDLILLVKNFYLGKWNFGDDTFDILNKSKPIDWLNILNDYFRTDGFERKAESIAKNMMSDSETSPQIKACMDDVKKTFHDIFECSENQKRLIDFTEGEILEWIKSRVLTDKANNTVPENIVKHIKAMIFDLTKPLAIIYRLIQLKRGYKLRDTQLISILTMWKTNNNVLLQVSTGEGKTCIAVVFAILKYLKMEKIHIVTSSSVLAIRDAQENADIYNYFGIKVDHNCHESISRRKEAYTCDVVYGTLGNFQRDYLLTEFFEQLVIPSGQFQNVLVDEVDNMILDKGNNTLYLSQDLPDLDEITGLFVFIWQRVSQNVHGDEGVSRTHSVEHIYTIVVDYVYGLLTEKDIEKMQEGVDTTEVIQILQQLKVIDSQKIIMTSSLNEAAINKEFEKFGPTLSHKIITYCREKIEKEKPLKFPSYMKSFIMNHLKIWIRSAIRALYVEPENEFVLDRSVNELIKDQVDINIIDRDTGTDMRNSQWDSGFHQFVQLRFGLSFSPLSLKSVYISNTSFLKLYKKLYGMTGTLGTFEERKIITKIYETNYATVPQYMVRKFNEYVPVVETSSSAWQGKIKEEVRSMLEKNRSVLIICDTIQNALGMKKIIGPLTSPKEDLQNPIMYTRETKKLGIEKLPCGYVIISTNLAGRGTNIKLDDELVNNGGLHVILINLPDNARIEEQAFGRAARGGENGSGRLIMYADTKSTVAKLKSKRNLLELKRLNEMYIYYKNYIQNEEKLFKKFHDIYKELKSNCKETTYALNFLIQWAFWLDENSRILGEWRTTNKWNTLEMSFNKFLGNKKTLHPVMKTRLYREILSKDNQGWFTRHIEEAKKILRIDHYDDLFSHQYFKLFEMLRNNQEENKWKPRQLYRDEKKQLLICYRMVQSIIKQLGININQVNCFKEGNSKRAKKYKGFEEQQQLIIECFTKLSEGLKEIMGDNINPHTLGSKNIDSMIMRTQLYEELLKWKCVTLPRINDVYLDESVMDVAKNHGIEYDKLKKFLKNNSDLHFSHEEFSERIESFFKLPNRQGFWNTLKAKGILTDEVEYCICDIKAIKNVDPSAAKILQSNLKNEVLFDDSKASSIRSILFVPHVEFVDKRQEEEKGENLVVRTRDFESFINSAIDINGQHIRKNHLLKYNAIQINKKATFNMEKFEAMKKGKIFDDFDEIHRDDFNTICPQYEEIIQKMIELKILEPRDVNTFELKFDEFEKFNHQKLENCFVYAPKLVTLIKSKFSYRIALMKLVEIIDQKNPVISLDINPYLALQSDLMNEFIIEESKVDSDRIDECGKLLNQFQLEDSFKDSGIIYNNSMIQELEAIINNNQTDSKAENIELSKDFVDIEDTVMLLLKNYQTLKEALLPKKKITDELLEGTGLWEKYGEIKMMLKDKIQAISNNDSKVIKVELIPLEKTLSENHFLSLMEMKGIEVVIKVQNETYSFSYWFRFFVVVIFSIAQIYVSTLLAGAGLGVIALYGAEDLVFVAASLKTGNFTWSDYWQHKKNHLNRLVTTYGIGAIFSKCNYLWSAVSSAGKSTFEKIAHSVMEKNNLLQLFMGAKGEMFKQLLKDTAKSAGLRIATYFKVSEVIAAANYFIDQMPQPVLNNIVDTAVDKILNMMSKSFKSHKISETINKLMEYFDTKEVKTMFLLIFGTVQTFREKFDSIISKAGNAAENSLDKCWKSSNKVSLVMSKLSNAVEKFCTERNLSDLFDELNRLLKGELDKKEKDEKATKKQVDPNAAEEVKKEMLEVMKNDAKINFENSFTSIIVNPIVNNAIRGAADIGIDFLLSEWKKISDGNFNMETARTLRDLEEFKKSCDVNDVVLADLMEKKLLDLLGRSRDPALHAKFMLENIPFGISAMESVPYILNRVYGESHHFIVHFEGLMFEFGQPKTDVEPKNLFLINNHFTNTNSNEADNDCLYYALLDLFPELNEKLSAKEFREQISNEILTNENVRAGIEKGNVEFYYNIRLYGGAAKYRNKEGLILTVGMNGGIKVRTLSIDHRILGDSSETGGKPLGRMRLQWPVVEFSEFWAKYSTKFRQRKIFNIKFWWKTSSSSSAKNPTEAEYSAMFRQNSTRGGEFRYARPKFRRVPFKLRQTPSKFQQRWNVPEKFQAKFKPKFMPNGFPPKVDQKIKRKRFGRRDINLGNLPRWKFSHRDYRLNNIFIRRDLEARVARITRNATRV